MNGSETSKKKINSEKECSKRLSAAEKKKNQRAYNAVKSSTLGQQPRVKPGEKKINYFRRKLGRQWAAVSSNQPDA